MGMAASQARYLGLSARKTNVEYEGQQINQARVALANQSAGLFNQMLTLEVPTAPSTADFTRVQYSYTDGITGETIENMEQLIDDPDGYNYMVKHYHYATEFKGQRELLTNPQVATDGATPPIPTYVGTQKLEQYVRGEDKDADTALDQICADWPDDFVAKLTATASDKYYNSDGQEVVASSPAAVKHVVISTDAVEKTYIKNGGTWPTDPTYVKYAPDNVYIRKSVDGKIMFALYDDLIASAESAIDPTKPVENQQVKLVEFYAEDNKTKVERNQRALVTINGQGRAESIRYEDSSQVFVLEAETITDEVAYNDAMNQYVYKREVYDKAIQDINAKTEAIQAEDRTLELRLRQLDTEQDALQTEMEAVKKVIEKNVESTFKTFE